MLDVDDQQVLFLVSIVFNALSFLTCLGLLCSYSQSHHSSSIQSKVAINIILSNCMLSITGFSAYLLDREDNYFKINTALSLMALWSSAYWPSVMGVLLYKKIAKPRSFNSVRFYNYSIFAWMTICGLVPLMLILILFEMMGINYSPVENKFEKETDSPQYITTFALLEAIPFLTSILTTFITALLKIKTLKEFDLFRLAEIKASRLLRYPMAQCLIFLPCLVCKTWYLINPYNSLILNSIRLFGYYLAGFIDFFVYRTQSNELKGGNEGLLASKILPSGYETSSRHTNSDDGNDYYDEEEVHYREA